MESAIPKLQPLRYPERDPAPEVCATCRHWNRDLQQNAGPNTPAVAPCHRYPVTIALVTMPSPIKGAPPQVGPAGLPHPMTSALDYCGEWRAPKIPS